MSKKNKKLPVLFHAEVLQQIRQHARSSMEAEICGVLIGQILDGHVVVEARIEGDHAAQGGAHVTFTQETWEHIYRIKDRHHVYQKIVGWYHSHPGFGIFLSEYDTFIHENFFSATHQVAWVFDPHSDEEGCFAWDKGKLCRLKTISVVNSKADENERPCPEPDRSLMSSEDGTVGSSWLGRMTARVKALFAQRGRTPETEAGTPDAKSDLQPEQAAEGRSTKDERGELGANPP